jgi:hypothetical protein
MTSSEIPYATEQGIFGGLTGNSLERTGNLIRSTKGQIADFNSDASQRIAPKALTFCIPARTAVSLKAVCTEPI